MHRHFFRSTFVLALVGAVALGLSHRDTVAQDATPATTTGHPLVGTWIIDRDTSGTTEAPAVAVFTADGTSADAGSGFSGVWQATGPTTADFNFIGIIDAQDGFSGYFVVGGPIEVDATGDAWTQTYTVMTVTDDGTVVQTTPPSTAHATRLQVVPEGKLGTALAEVPTWASAPDAGATPTS